MENTMEETIQELYSDNGKKLRKMCHREMDKFGGIWQKDYDDFYSRAGLEICVAKDRYDPTRGRTFMEYISGVIRNSVRKEMTDHNRKKRRTVIVKEGSADGRLPGKNEYIADLSIDAEDADGLTMGDVLRSDSDMDEILFRHMDGCQDERVETYLGSLSAIGRRMIEMKMEGIPVSVIREALGLTDKEYRNHMKDARLNENLVLFTKQSNRYREGKGMRDIIPLDVTDNYRMDKYPLGSLLDDMRDGKINKKHILQRKPFQWTERQKNKFLTRVLNGQPVPEIVICEQTINGRKKSHLIDGLQRLSYSELFRADGVVVKREGAEFYEIPYREYQYDGNGNILLDEAGDALSEEKVFNVIGKKFSEFPAFLKERFQKFNVNVTTYFNCTDEQIAYHIRNYNNQEGMNKNQYGFTGMDIHVADKIKCLSEKHAFFKDDYGKYTGRNKVKGDVDKVVAESIMAIYFLNEWKKEVKDSYAYVSKHATDGMFESFRDSLDRLCGFVDKEVRNMFTVTNSPVWFAVFDRFKSLNLPDGQFKAFMLYVDKSLERLTVNGKAFVDVYKSKNTRDKTVVAGKINGLVSLMHAFFGLDGREGEDERADEEAFLARNLGMDRRELHSDLDFYAESLENLTHNTVRDGSRLLEEGNRLSMLAMMIYSYKVDEDLEDWLREYAEKDPVYLIDQEQNFRLMKQDFLRYRGRAGTA